MSNRKLVIIGASELQLPLILKAKDKGYETHVFAWKCGDVGEKEADVFYPISIVEKELILEECKKILPDGIVTIASDLAVITVNYVANKLNLIGNPIEDVKFTTNKFLMRERLTSNNIKCPKYIKTNNSQNDIDLKYPLIVKPTDRSGSRGVSKIESNKELKLAIENAINQSFSNEAIIEEFVKGKEYSVEFISQNGIHKFLAITEKITTGSPNFIEIGHIQPARIDKKMVSVIEKYVRKALDALNIKNGASHSEIMITDDNDIFVIEIGARMGGDCIGSDLVEISTGFDFVNAVIDCSCGIMNPVIKEDTGVYGVVKYIFNEKDLKSLMNIKRKYGECIRRVSNIKDIINSGNIKDSSQRYGFYIIETKNKELIDSIFDKQ